MPPHGGFAIGLERWTSPAYPGREHPGGHAVPPGSAPPDTLGPGGGSRVDAEASGCLVVPPVFKTGGRRAASSAGSIPVRLRYLRERQLRAGQPRLLPEAGITGITDTCWHDDDSRRFTVPSPSAALMMPTVSAAMVMPAVARPGNGDLAHGSRSFSQSVGARGQTGRPSAWQCRGDAGDPQDVPVCAGLGAGVLGPVSRLRCPGRGAHCRGVVPFRLAGPWSGRSGWPGAGRVEPGRSH